MSQPKTWIFISLLSLGAAFRVDAAETTSFDHSHALFDHVLKQHVQDGLVDYSTLKRHPGGLNRYLDQLAAVPRDEFDTWSEPQQIAFLINLYNASTLHLILQHYPVDSIKDIGWVFKGPFDQEIVRLFGETVDLDKVEHGILRAKYDEPRIHFALVCAALSCPKLRSEPYRAADLDRQLQEQGRVFLRDQEKNRVDLQNHVIYLSPIFKWFREDFVKHSGSLPAFVRPYFPEATREVLSDGKVEVRFTDYNWSLNDLKARGQ
jgi:hypothetical protein